MNRLSLLLLMAVLGTVWTLRGTEPDPREDGRKTLPEYLGSYGYNFETHKVITGDGYILTLWRIPKKVSERRQRRPPVLLQHGVLDNAFSWLFKVIERNLPIMLVNLGFDVWIGSNRGTLASLEHKDVCNYNWRNIFDQYWDFSFDEMGKYDLPANVDYILDITGYDKLTYIGHSQGTAQFWVKTMLDPAYINSHIQAFVGLSPVLYVSHAPGLFERLLNWSHIVDVLYMLHLKNFWALPFMTPVNSLIMQYFPNIMPFVVQLIAGWTKNQTLDLSRMGYLGNYEPGGTSTQNMLHWLQMMRQGGVRMFDFGEEDNLKKYGQKTPPEYDVTKLKQLKIPILLMAGNCDNIIGWDDLAALFKLLPNGHHYQEVDDYGHLDYIWADNAFVKIYPQIIQFIKQHQSKL